MIKPRKAVMEMEEYKPPTSGRSSYMRLDFNENTVGSSLTVVNAMKETKRDYLATYPEYSGIRKALAEYCNVGFEDIIVTNATDEAIKTVIEAYIEKGVDEIIIPVPTFAMFKFYAQLNEAAIKEITYNDDLSFPTNAVLNAINYKTKIVILVNPNNPTGTSIKEEDIIKIIEKANENDALVLIDEAYYQFYGRTSISLTKKYDNLIVTQTFSKAFGLAGLRIGYIISNKENIINMRKVLSPYSVNNAAIMAAFAALKDKEYAMDYAEEVRKSKELLYGELDNLGLAYYRSDANFVLLNIGDKSGYFCDRMREMGILVRDRSSDRLLKGYVRVTLGIVKQTKELIESLQKTIKELNPLLIFDIDGVLVDVSKSYRVAIKRAVEYFTGKEVSLEEVQQLKNEGGYNNDWDASEELIKRKGKIIGKQKIIDKFQEFYKELVSEEIWLLDKAILYKLSKKYTLAIFTGRTREEAKYVLEANNALGYFSKIIAMGDVLERKPKPEGILKILNGYNGREAYYFGDMVDDMNAAVAANVIAVGVLPPQDKSDKMKALLIGNGAKYVLTDINDLAEVLK